MVGVRGPSRFGSGAGGVPAAALPGARARVARRHLARYLPAAHRPAADEVRRVDTGRAAGAAPDGWRALAADRIRAVVGAAQELDSGGAGMRYRRRPGVRAGAGGLMTVVSDCRSRA